MALAMGRPFYLTQHLLRAIGSLAQDQKQHPGFPDRLGDLTGIGQSALDITWRHPAVDSLGLQCRAHRTRDLFVIARVGDKDCMMQFWRLRLSRVRALCLFHRFLSIGAAYLIDE